ncbi:DUF1631 family protein [Marinobacter zhejiangensis]|uniref:Diguanylate cyclase/phosphodiesterase n=1 Tax=Marinobacter zhejiangensis TaxID=488535 RepID=A0A1I4L4L3_9GAMM|nr:DUF1631 family protein [Marinobacter zhejiangensis]SFL85577.1 diguanylate cyclase/phosphodiesterase [Marinobacter zhejiangensis]
MVSKERRSSPRKAIKLAAQLVLEDGISLPCQIADFCAEGLFVRYSGDTERKLQQALGLSSNNLITLRFREADGRSRHEITVSVIRRMAGAMGVVFARSNPEAVAAMLQLCGGGQSMERSLLRPPNERVQFILHQCARAVVQYIEPLMDACFPSMLSALEKAAQHASSDRQANDYMDATGVLAARRKIIWHHMQQSLQSPLKPVPQGPPGAELSLVDKGEFEDWLTLRVMVTKADTLYRGELLQLKLRLDRLSVSNDTGHQNPLGPALICEAFHAGLALMKASRAVEKVCLKAFEATVLNHLAPLYEELNQILIRHGVLPDLDLSKYLSERRSTRSEPDPRKPAKAIAEPAPPVAEPPQAKSAEPAQKEPVGAMVGGASRSEGIRGFQAHTQAAQSAFATVRNLLSTLSTSRLAYGDLEPVRFAPNARPLSAGEYQRQLQQLQVAEPVAGEAAASLRERVIGHVRESGDTRLDNDQQEVLDVVDRFFGSVVESPRLSQSAQQQLRQLEVPVLKVVMRDPSFFEDTSSPVRGVIDRLAQLSVKGGRVNPVTQRRVSELVQRIVNEFEQDTGIFEQAVQELDGLIERQNLVYRRNVERVTAAAEGGQKVADSKTAVAAALDQRLSGRQVPKVVLSLLNGGWRDLLSLTWIRQGEDSQLWQDYLSVIDSLLAFGEDPDSAINLPELLRVIQDGLASISSNHMPPSQIREQLKQFLVRAPGAVTAEFVDVAPERTPKPAVGDASEREQRSLQRWISRAQQLRTGDWLRDQDNPDSVQYIRLVWIARGFSRFVFVNHQGMRVVELELADLARQMKRGVIVPDSQYDRPLVDESIDRMVRKVYDQLSWASTHDELTGLLARREFERMLEQQLARHEDERTLVILDLRQFRLLNDTAGYQAGDEALKDAAKVLEQRVGDGMPLARLAGNEFGFLLPTETAEADARAIIAAVEAMVIKHDDRVYHLSANAGLAPALPVLSTPERWLRAADEACKQAKQLGNARVATYTAAEGDRNRQEQIAAKLASLGDLDEERMLLRCQKIIPLHARTRMATQHEILISMYDDQGNLITGSDFVRTAERYNQMQAVDRWVVGHLLDWLRESELRAEQLGGVCINLSGYSLNDESLLEFIYDKLSEKNAPIERLWFEITEAASINDIESVVEFIEEMKELGCRFCLGSYGTGASSYQFMRRLPVDLIKLDGSFTAQIASNQADRAMVASIVELAHYMNREVIASHVETRDVLDTLRQLGVDYAQGYVVEKPRLLDSVN